MARRINDSCIGCGACAISCPVEGITAGEGKYHINSKTCIDCGECEGMCPVEAIETE